MSISCASCDSRLIKNSSQIVDHVANDADMSRYPMYSTLEVLPTTCRVK
jgi:hypothetical protein